MPDPTAPTVEDVFAEAAHEAVCSCEPGDRQCSWRTLGLTGHPAVAAVVAAVRAMTTEQLRDLRPDLLGAFCVAYDDETPHMDGPHTIRMGEFASIQSARDALAVLTARSSRAPKRNARIEARLVGPWQETP